MVEAFFKHTFLQLEEKKADTEKAEEKMVEEEQERDEAISSIQVRLPCCSALTPCQGVILGHHSRAASLAAARARGGIFIARPWVAPYSRASPCPQAGGTLSEGDESEEEIDKLQGIIRCVAAHRPLTTRQVPLLPAAHPARGGCLQRGQGELVITS